MNNCLHSGHNSVIITHKAWVYTSRVQNSGGLYVSVLLVHIHIHHMTAREVSRAMFKGYLTHIAFSFTAVLQSQTNQS